jgi:hypothetical protein
MSGMPSDRELTPEGELIEAARMRLDPRTSQNEAARRAGMSGTRWRQIVKSEAPEMTSARGVAALVRMAQIVGLTSTDFANLGRKDVAEKLSSGDDKGQRAREAIAAMYRAMDELEGLLSDDRNLQQFVAGRRVIELVVEEETSDKSSP